MLMIKLERLAFLRGKRVLHRVLWAAGDWWYEEWFEHAGDARDKFNQQDVAGVRAVLSLDTPGDCIAAIRMKSIARKNRRDAGVMPVTWGELQQLNAGRGLDPRDVVSYAHHHHSSPGGHP